MSVIAPDLDWYKKKSLDQEVNIRCPFTYVEACPRYYQSLPLMGEARAIKIEPRGR